MPGDKTECLQVIDSNSPRLVLVGRLRCDVTDRHHHYHPSSCCLDCHLRPVKFSNDRPPRSNQQSADNS